MDRQRERVSTEIVDGDVDTTAPLELSGEDLVAGR